MALLFADGLDIYDSQADVVDGGITKVEGASHTQAASGGRYGGGYIGGTGTFPGWGVPCTKGPGSTFWFSFAYWHDGNGSNVGNGDYWIYPRDAGGGQNFQLFHKADGAITIISQAGGVVAGPTGTALSANTWHWVEVEITLGTDNVTGEVIVKVDGSTIVSASAMDTYVSGSNMATIGFYGSSGEFRVDDIIVNDTTGTHMTTPPGDCRIDTLRPDADGGVTDWTGTYADVDDALGSSDGDTTHIASTTAAQESRFTLSALPSSSSTIHAVQARLKAKNENAGVRTVRSLINSSATEALGASFVPDTAYKWSRDLFTVDPNTTVAFVDAGVNALEAGVEVVS